MRFTLSQGKRLSASYWRAVGCTTLWAKARTRSRKRAWWSVK